MVYINKRTIKVKDDILLSIYENYKEKSPIEMITREWKLQESIQNIKILRK